MVANLADWFTIVGVPIAIVAIAAACLQLWQAHRIEQRRKRPYVSVRFAFDHLADGRRCVVLMFQNLGATPANHVRVQFPSGVVWNHVRKKADLPFERPMGITVLHPHQTIKYLVAVSEKRNPLEHLLTQNFSVHVSYSDGSKSYEETSLLGLDDYAFSLRNS